MLDVASKATSKRPVGGVAVEPLRIRKKCHRNHGCGAAAQTCNHVFLGPIITATVPKMPRYANVKLV